MIFLRDTIILIQELCMSHFLPCRLKKLRMDTSCLFVTIIHNIVLWMPIYNSFKPIKSCNKNEDKMREDGDIFLNEIDGVTIKPAIFPH